MEASIDATRLPPGRLVEIIRTQAEMATFGFDLGGLMTFAAERARDLTGARGVIVELAEGDDMVCRAAAGVVAGQLGLRLKRGGSLSGLCAADGRVLRCDDAETDDRVDREACRRIGLRSMVASPLKCAHVTVGVMKIVSPHPDAFSDQDVAILELVADLTATAMFTAARYETDELVRRASEDELTGLPNRAAFYDRLRRELDAARRERLRLGVVFIDLDDLMFINDDFGRRAGDAAVREVGTRIRSVSRDTDLAARVGGYGFAALLTDIGDPWRARSCVDRITRTIRSPFLFEDRVVRLDASAGVAVFPDDGRDVDTLIAAADGALRAAKREREANR